jgi:tRNA dimethylallyltransferase
VGVAALHSELAARDPAAAAAILPSDGRRVVRALEVIELTGQPFSASAPRIGAARWDTAIIGLDWPTGQLDDRLAQRTDAMFDDGLVEEVRGLLHRGLRDGVTAARALGYAQVIDALDGGATPQALQHAREATFIGTRRYVRRQRSWFRRDHRIHWLDGASTDLVGAALAHRRDVSSTL